MVNPISDTRRPNRGRIVSVRFDRNEYELIASAAARAGISVSALIRAAAFDAVEAARSVTAVAIATDGAPQAQPQVPAKELIELRTEVNRVGVNINQIARLWNKHNGPVISAEESPEKVEETISEMISVMANVDLLLGGVRPK